MGVTLCAFEREVRVHEGLYESLINGKLGRRA